MDETRAARSAGHGLSALVGVALLSVAAAPASGCGGKVVVDRVGNDGAASSLGGGTGGAGGSGRTRGLGGSAGSEACALTSTGATTATGGPPEFQTTECLAMPVEGCPSVYNAAMFIVPHTSCVYVSSVDCGPVLTQGVCCYLVTEQPLACGG